MYFRKLAIDKILSVFAVLLGFAVLHCTPPATAPVPVITPDSMDAFVGQTVELSGAESRDQDEDYPLRYLWDFESYPAGSEPVFNDPTIVNPSFVPFETGVYVVRLGVMDSAGNYSNFYDTATITVSENQPPVIAGISWDPPEPSVGNIVRLSCEVSDPDSDLFSYLWELTARPVGSAAVLDDVSVPSPSFQADRAGSYAVAVSVTDPEGNTSDPFYAAVNVQYENQPPVADITPASIYAYVGQTVHLNGGESYDPDGDDPLSYAWELVTKPEGSSSSLNDPTLVDPSFVPDVVGMYEISLSVTDSAGNPSIDPDYASVTVTLNSTPTAEAGGPYYGYIDLPIQFDGINSGDPDGDVLTYSWDFGDPANPDYVGEGAQPEYAYPAAGTYTVTLTVTDSMDESVDYTTATMIREIPDTGQTKYYDDIAELGPDDPLLPDYPGQDAAYDDGIAFAEIIDDSMLERIVHDTLSDLYWEADTNDTDYNRTLVTYGQAVQDCDERIYGGYDDWRLPSRSELLTIVNYGSLSDTEPSPFALFEETTAYGHYWTNTASRFNPENVVFFVGFGGYPPDQMGTSFGKQITDYAYARCVRGEPLPTAHDLVDNGDGTITDMTTDYMWTQTPLPASTDNGDTTWQDALNFCEQLGIGPYGDWRLPNIKQLETLTDFSQTTSQVINGEFFDSSEISGLEFSSSTTMEFHISDAWHIDFSTGDINPGMGGGEKGYYPRNALCLRKISD